MIVFYLSNRVFNLLNYLPGTFERGYREFAAMGNCIAKSSRNPYRNRHVYL